MSLSSKKLEDISEPDLQALCDNGTSEGKFIEYKRGLPDGSDSDKKEFLFDVSSFANAGGGDLIFGVQEEGGAPKNLLGIKTHDTDAEIRRWESLILDGIEPRIPGLGLRFVTRSAGPPILVIRIPKSWVSPHMVVFKGSRKFYSRNSAGKYLLDVGELRTLFSLSGDIATRIREFKAERLGRILAGETPVELQDWAKTILHIIPFQSFSLESKIDLKLARNQFLGTLGSVNSSSSGVNLDGLINYVQSGKNECSSYLQLFHNGIIETVDALTLNLDLDSGFRSDKAIPSTLFEQGIIERMAKWLPALKSLGLTPPFAVIMTLSGVKGSYMATRNPHFGSQPIDRDLLPIPEIILHSFDFEAKHVKPLLDSVWNAAGKLGSPNFTTNDRWTPA